MQQTPAACGSCGYLYPSGYYFDPGGTGIAASAAVLENAQVTIPCPMCGRQRGSVLASEYQFVDDTATFLQAPEHTTEEREQLGAFVREAQERGEPVDKIRERADTKEPGLSALLEKLLTDKPAGLETATWLALLTGTLNSLAITKENGSTGKLVPSEVIYGSFNEYNVTTVQPPSPTDEDRLSTAKVGRNDPCPCGSGKKFKKCHGNPTRTAGAP